MFVGDFSTVSPGDIKTFSIDFAAQLGAGETISSVSGAVSVTSGSPADPNAASLPVGAASKAGTVVSQMLGASSGFQPGVTYIWKVTATTSAGQSLVNHGHIPCAAVS
jgi:hypothetical protein